MRTLIQLHNANCSECLNAIQDQLRAQQRIRAVHLDAAHGCIEVDHDHDDPEVIVEQLRRSLRGWQIAANGEIVQVPEAPEVTHVCRSARAETAAGANEFGGEAPCIAHLLDGAEFRADWPR
jgi:hypothetical protein